MPPNILARLKDRMRSQSAEDFATPEGRRLAMWHDHVFDQAFVRVPWTNFATVAPDVFRSNHPPPARLARYIRDHGIRTVLNLRGAKPVGHYHAERAVCAAEGARMIDAQIYARKPASKRQMVALAEALRTMETPALIHCKSGADRAGLASVLYRHLVLGEALEEARAELGARRWHFRKSATGVLDHLLDLYGASGKEFDRWLDEDYDPNAIQASFDALRWWHR